MKLVLNIAIIMVLIVGLAIRFNDMKGSTFIIIMPCAYFSSLFLVLAIKKITKRLVYFIMSIGAFGVIYQFLNLNTKGWMVFLTCFLFAFLLHYFTSKGSESDDIDILDAN